MKFLLLVDLHYRDYQQLQLSTSWEKFRSENHLIILTKRHQHKSKPEQKNYK